MLNVFELFETRPKNSSEPEPSPGGRPVFSSLIGSPASQRRIVTSVHTVSNPEEIAKLPVDALIIVPQSIGESGNIAFEMILRRAAAAKASCVVSRASASELPLTTRDLAGRFDIALWNDPALNPNELHSQLSTLVEDPERIGAARLRDLSQSLQTPVHDLRTLVDNISTALGSSVCMIRSDGARIAGASIGNETLLSEALESMGERYDADIVFRDGNDVVRLIPAFPLVTDAPRFWLGVRATPGISNSSGFLAVGLRIASLACSSHLNQAALIAERENRDAHVLLDSICARGSKLSATEVEHAAARGWQLFGWHTGVYVHIDASLTDAPESALFSLFASSAVRHGLAMLPVSAGRSIRFWQTSLTPPTDSASDDLAARATLALTDVTSAFPGAKVRAGVGASHQGPSGVRSTLESARSALAAAEREPGSLIMRRSDHLPAHGLLESWLPESATRDLVLARIAPLTAADGAPELVETLHTYLDLESNTTATAAALNVHRNTILQRLQRIRELLPLDLDDPSQRLLVQLGLRLVRSEVSG